MSGRAHEYTSGSMRRAIVLLAIPMVLEMGMESLFVVVDIFFVAKLGPDAVTAVGLTEAVLTLLYAIAIGLSTGATALVARRIGERNLAAARIVAVQTIWVGVTLALAIGIAGLAYAEEILLLMGASREVVGNGSGFTSIMLGGSATILLIFLLNAVFRGAGNAVIAMRALWIANAINIALDPLLIFGIGPFPELGVTGAAVATTIGRGTGVLYQFYCLSREGELRLRPSHFSLRIDVLLRLLRVSVPGAIQYAIAMSSYMFLMRIVAAYGSAAVAGFTIGIRIFAFTFLPAWGMSNAASTLVGQNLGARQPERAERSVWIAAKYNAVFLVLVAVVFIATPGPLVRVFTADAVVVAYAVDCLRYIAFGYGFYAVGMVVVAAFNGAGDTDTPTYVNLLCYWILQIPLGYVLAETLGQGPRGVFIAIAICDSLLALIAVWLFRRGRWKLRVV
ncbi:MAG TPA: MATE family efflux transporter [Gammaproteobacteria bacterium]